MIYTLAKTVHVVSVSLSLAGFFVRGLGIIPAAGWAEGRMSRTLPHINDSILLVSALVLVWSIGASPANSPWLLAKIVGLLVYVALGSMAIRPGRSMFIRVLAWFLAVWVFGYIVSVAISKRPAGFFLLFGDS